MPNYRNDSGEVLSKGTIMPEGVLWSIDEVALQGDATPSNEPNRTKRPKSINGTDFTTRKAE